MAKSRFLNKARKKNLSTLIDAAKNDDLALIECVDTKTGKKVAVICAVYMKDGEYIFIPVAKQFDGNPYDEVSPPNR